LSGAGAGVPPQALERLILTVRLLTCWNSPRIAGPSSVGRGVSPFGHGQIVRLWPPHGSHRPSYVRTPGPRYERTAINELWHIES
jgi:hypothetical protein